MTSAAKERGELRNLSTNPIATVSDPLAFNKRIIDARLADYKAASIINNSIVFYDRGIPDVLAYMDFFEQPIEKQFRAIAANNRYDVIFLLPIWKEIYVSDNERFESYAEALSIHRHLKKSYSDLGYDVIVVPKDTIENRIQFILTQLEIN